MTRTSNDQTRQLQDAFMTFNQMSIQLEASYRDLEQRVAELNTELSEARSQRMQQLAEKEGLADRLTTLLDTLPAGVVVLDNENRVQECNAAAMELLGEPLLGELWYSIKQRVFLTDKNDSHEIKFRDGRRINISSRPLGTQEGRILLLQDVTETRKLQEIVDRQQRLSSMGEMTATLAHQIRTPLSAALLYASHLHRQKLDEKSRMRFSERLLSGLHRLEGMVDDMLMFARGNAVGDELIAVSDLVDELNQVLESQLKQRHASLQIDNQLEHDTSIIGNRQALISVLQNLVTNSLQFTRDAVQLDLSIRENTDGLLELIYRDNGPGIPVEMQNCVFDPFFTTRSEGTGLGLAVVRAVIESHHGKVELLTQDVVGACFRIILPLAHLSNSLPGGCNDSNVLHLVNRSRGHNKLNTGERV